MIAFACEPYRGSEPGVGFEMVRALAVAARKHDWSAHVFTRPHRVQAIRQALAVDNLEDALVIHPIRLPSWLVAVTKRRRVRIAAVVWQMLAVRAVGKLVRTVSGPVVVHHATFATDGLPTFEWWLPRAVSRVLGPAGSSQAVNRSVKGESLLSALRRWVVRKNIRGLALAIAQNDDVRSQWRPYAPRIIVEPNVFVELPSGAGAPPATPLIAVVDGEGRPSEQSPDGALVSIGLLQERKRHHLAISALAHLDDSDTRLFIVGDGPLLQELQGQAVEWGVADRVFFTGKMRRDETLALLGRCRVLLHPSRQEGAPAVVGEAQSVGVPPVVFEGSGSDTVVRLGGLGVIVREQTGAALARAASRLMAVNEQRRATKRWEARRLPGLLADWYSIALDVRGAEMGG